MDIRRKQRENFQQSAEGESHHENSYQNINLFHSK